MEATKPMNARINAPSSCQQVLADRSALAQPIQGSAAFSSGL